MIMSLYPYTIQRSLSVTNNIKQTKEKEIILYILIWPKPKTQPTNDLKSHYIKWKLIIE